MRNTAAIRFFGQIRRTAIFWMVAVFLPALLVAPSMAALAEQQEVLQLYAVPPLEPHGVFGNAWWIYANGVIDKYAAQRLARLIEKNDIPNDSIFIINSPGGELFAGMELGKLIRRHEFRTYVGAQGEEIVEKFGASGWGGTRYKDQPGACVSACALAFLGGPFRYLSKGVYGVHRFFAGTGALLDSDQAQIVSAAILQYIRDMGVDEALFTEMAQAGKDEMKILPESRLVALGVVNNGVGKTTWTIETAGDYGLYMKGQRDTVFGEQKLTMMCANKNSRLAVMAFFDPKGNADQITRMSAISLEIDGSVTRIPSDRVVEKPTLNHGWINVMVTLDSQLVSRLMTAKAIGIMAQFAFEAPVFQGIGGMDFTDGAKKLPAFLKSCH